MELFKEMSKGGVISSAAVALVAGLGVSNAASAEAWHKAYVVDWMEPAYYHAGDPEDNNAPGADCPEGTTPHVDYREQLKTPWRDAEDIEFFLRAENRAYLQRILRYRGPNYEDVWEQPWLGRDFNMPTVQSEIAYGFDLDGDATTGGFTSPDGVPGIDNAYYLVGGCWVSFRGQPYTSQRGMGINGYMRDGLYTIVIVISGEEDPMNDENATLAFYQAEDNIVKDALGGVAHDATFNIRPDPRTQSIIPVRVRDGVVESREPAEIRLRDENWNRSAPDQMQLELGQIRLETTENGGLLGYFGGYRDWRVVYRKQAVTGRDTEMLQGLDLPSFYFSLQRNADWDPDPETGENRRISVAYRLRAVPAFVMDPTGARVVTGPEIFDETADEAPTRVAAQ